jgi:FkbM family methyltransferase
MFQRNKKRFILIFAKMGLKDGVRKLLWWLHFDVTRNMRYDRMTYRAMRQLLKQDSTAVDVGCHKGEVLEWMIELSPNGHHFAVEPLPHLAQALRDKFSSKVNVVEKALSNVSGSTTFQFVKNAPAYSGILKRSYDTPTPEIEELKVDMTTIDEMVKNTSIDFIKIDVEGGEYAVLQGAEQTIKNNQPVVVFECGKGATEFYATTPQMIFDWWDNMEYDICSLPEYLSSRSTLSRIQFQSCFDTGSEYYFIAFPRMKNA